MTATAAPTVHRGLAGVVVDETSVSYVDQDTNSLLYRGYPVTELAQRCSFEEVGQLLRTGELPTVQENAAFCQRERAAPPPSPGRSPGRRRR